MIKSSSANIKIHKKAISFFSRKTIFLLLSVIVLIVHIPPTKKEIIKMVKKRKAMPYIFIGFKFSGLKDILQDEDYVGYYTDKSMDESIDAAQFTQAQYILAPKMLDFNKINHKYVILDFSSPIIAIQKIKEDGLVVIRQNQFGIFLTKNPRIN